MTEDRTAALRAAPARQLKPVAYAVVSENGGVHKLSVMRESAERKMAKWLAEWPNNKCRIEPLFFGE